MDFVHLAATHGFYIVLAGLCFLSAVFPLVSAELVVVSLAVAVPNQNILLLAGVATAAQMLGKSSMYWVGRRMAGIVPGRYERAAAKWRGWLQQSRRSTGLFLLVSAASGLPPFYLISTLAGLFQTNFATFLVAGSAGRFIRFASLGLFPYALHVVA